MRFGLGVPTATEGMMYPVPFASPAEAVRLGEAAEELGFESVWGNDHLTTQAYVRDEFPDPPRFYDPLGYLAYLAARTSRIRLATCVLVLPFRHPVLVAKQAATLDHLSGGRAVLGVGIGAYREEFEATWPGRPLNRGAYAAECLEALDALFTQRRASYAGEWLSFADVESYPKPLQARLPILSGGNAPGSRTRAALLADGWLPACLSPAEVAAGRRDIAATAERAGRRLPDGFEVAVQVAVAMAPTRERALARFRSSQVYAHLRSLSRSTLKDQDLGEMESRNLIGTPDDVRAQVAAYAEAGVDTLAGLLFATDTVEETLDAMGTFAGEVIGPLGDRREDPVERSRA
jgi:probable F420-dependent oxidoreductase